MISLNNVTGSQLTALNAANTQHTAVAKPAPEQTPAAVVQVQSKLGDDLSASGLKLDAQSAKQMAADLAALLAGGQGLSAQANVNGFDAARLLA